MKLRLLVLSLTLACAGASLIGLQREWETYKMHHHLWYTEYEDTYRLGIYVKNLMRITAHNAGRHSHKLGVTPFTHLTAVEFKNKTRSKVHSTGLVGDSVPWTTWGQTPKPTKPSDGSVDWRAKVPFGPVADQGKCSACWAFAAASAVEACLQINGMPLQPNQYLSVEEQVQCSTVDGDDGCEGGLPEYTFKYIHAHGLTDAKTYPYTGTSGGVCRASTMPRVAHTTGYIDVSPNNPVALQAAVNINPVVVCIEADADVFQLYTSGVITSSTCGTDWDHAALIVGYGTSTVGGPFWQLRNSWGPNWGEKGYVRIKRDTTNTDTPQGHGICGINMKPSYPTCKPI